MHLFIPLDVGGYSWMAPAAQSMDVSSASFTIGTTSQSSDAQPSSLLFTRPSTRPPLKAPLRIASEKLGKSLSSEEVSSEEARRREVMKLKRRFLKSRETTSAYFARSEARKKIMREVSDAGLSQLMKQDAIHTCTYMYMYLYTHLYILCLDMIIDHTPQLLIMYRTVCLVLHV